MIANLIKERVFPESNYKGIYFGGKTIRLALDKAKPIKELEYPEFYDVKITNKCFANCPNCYMDSVPNGGHATNALESIQYFFGSMNKNKRPFQVAIGGGEPTLHPDFAEILKNFYDLGITPNYTTNGMNLTDDIIDATKKYCGGVAISCHTHLVKYWSEAVQQLIDNSIKVNFHLIISDKESIDCFLSVFEKWKDDIEYFVLLPYTKRGRAVDKQIDFDYLSKKLESIDRKKIAFGAGFYEYLKGKVNWDISLYQPEILSKFLDLSDMSIHKSSFEL